MAPPRSTQELQERYRTPEDETPRSRKRRKINRRQARKRMHARRQLALQNPPMTVPRGQQNRTLHLALGYYATFEETVVAGNDVADGRHKLPQLDTICPHCNALKWNFETPMCCCMGGAIVFPREEDPPQELRTLLEDRHFQECIRSYNSAFAFTSMGASVTEPLRLNEQLATARDGVYTFRIQGAICHRIGSILPQEGRAPAFAQIYFHDTAEAQVNIRNRIFSNLKREIIDTLQTMLERINPYVHIFKTAQEFARNALCRGLIIHESPKFDQRRHNRPTADEVAAILIDDNNLAENRDLILHLREGGFKRIFESHQAYDPLQYPLLFPHGEPGWSFNSQYRNGATRNGNTKVSLREFTVYRLYTKPNTYSLIHRGGRLFQQFCVDQYAKIEQQNLNWQRNNQKHLRADLYHGLHDMTLEDASLSRTGRHIVLAPSFTGSDRYMYENYQDSMSIVREFGKPDAFITVTCNPSWPEVTEQLFTGQKSTDRPDVVARVFRAKLRCILDDLFKKQVFGEVIAYVYVIEFQKRGLPHAHILMIMGDEDKPRTTEDYDAFTSAEIPDQHTHPRLYHTIAKNMMHGPCGSRYPNAPCMKNGVCSKGFPKAFCESTEVNNQGYPLYRRRRDERTVTRCYTALDNRWVVPYNPFLSQKYNCHINVEICSTVASVKYLYKYVYKGHDRAVVSVGSERNEIQEYLDGRYISASEACWRIFGYELQKKSHFVEKLSVHLKDSQYVTYLPHEDHDEVRRRYKHTKLTRFFELCNRHPAAQDLLYQDVPKHFRWNASAKNWVFRQRGGDKSIGRMCYCSPADIERYHLRLLLCYRRGPKSFEDLRTVHGIEHPTYRGAAFAAGLLETDEEYHRCLEDAARFQMPNELRNLFAIILVYCQPGNCRDLWDHFLPMLAEDFMRTHSASHDNPIVLCKVLKQIEEHLHNNSKSLSDFPDLPQWHDYSEYHDEVLEEDINALLLQERSYDREELQTIVSDSAQLNEDQRLVYDQVIQSLQDSEAEHKCFFLDGPGGTGKSFVLRQILAAVRLEGKIALAVASSGIASLLLMGGRTAHSRLKIPMQLDENSTCNVTKQSREAKLFQKTSLIVWDEAPMTHRYGFEAVDRTLRDITDVDQPFGGKIMLLSGDFRQTLPVVPGGTDAQIISACIKRSYLWRYFKTLRLSVNMRVRTAPTPSSSEAMQAFANFLLEIGEGRMATHPHLGADAVQIPREFLLNTAGLQQPLEGLIKEIYGEIQDRYESDDYFKDRAILTQKNVDVHALNGLINDILPGEPCDYYSIDSVQDGDEQQNRRFPVEFLHSLKLSGMPPHKLTLKVHAPIILLRNIQGEQGLCNGTRLKVIRLARHCIDAVIMTGTRKGDRAFIPRITLISNNDSLPFRLRRRQFPVQLAYSMTINKAQGQSLHFLGLYLPQPVFAHGQLYVAFSRVTAKENIKVLAQYPQHEDEDGVYTRNVVYKQVL